MNRALINEEMVKWLFDNTIKYTSDRQKKLDITGLQFFCGVVSNYDLSLKNISWIIILARPQNIKRSKDKKEIV